MTMRSAGDVRAEFYSCTNAPGLGKVPYLVPALS
jgi:hypothetical protein